MRSVRLLSGAALAAIITCAQAQVITTVAGTDFTFPNTPLPAINAPTGGIFGVAVDASGNVFFSDYGNTRVFKMDPNGVLTVVAGNGAYGSGCYYYAPTGDGGPATGAALSGPFGLAVDAAGNLFIADQCLMQVRKVTPAGIISNVAGNGAYGYSGDGGPAVNATLGSPSGIALDSSGNLFIADPSDYVVRKVTPDGIITTVAGNGISGYSGDGGLAVNATLGFPFSVAVDAAGALFIADFGNQAVRKVSPAGIISTIAGNGTQGYSGDGGLATSAALGCPFGVTLDSVGNLFLADSCDHVIRKITPAGIISTVAGTFTQIEYAGGYSGDGGPATSAQLNYPAAVAVDVAGNLFIADAHNHRLRKVNPTGIINTVVGNGQYSFSGDGGPAISATLNDPGGLAIDVAGNLFIADTRNNRIRKVTPAGIISTIAGGGTEQSNSSSTYPGEGGPATSATLLNPLSVAVDGAGNLFIADSFANAIRKVTPAGIITTVITLNTSNLGGVPFHVVVDAAGDLFIADTFDTVIRKLTPSGYLSIFAGNGTAGYSGDGGPATSAALSYPTGLALDTLGNLFIGDSDNNVVRKVNPAGIITTVAGNGMAGYSGDGGLATNATLYHPRGVAVDAVGNIFISDRNSAIRKVTPAGIISTVAGNGTGGYSGDGGLAIDAVLNVLPDPSGQPNNEADVAVDAGGNLFIADTNNKRVREVLASRPAASVTPRQLQFSAASNGAPTTPQTLTVTSPVDGVAFSITTDADWLRLNPSSGGSPRLIQVTADPTGLAPMIYQATINISTPYASPAYTLVSVTLNVSAAVPPALLIDKQSLSFPFPQQGTARSQTITISNIGSGALQFTATATTNGGRNWLSVSPTDGQALPGSPAALTVTANPSGLSPGAYSGQLTVGAGGQSQTVAVTMTISKLDQAILLSQSGLSFLAVQSGGVVPTQSFGVMNIGTGVVNWTASTSTLTGGPGWLQVTPASGSSDAAAETSPRVTVSVNGSVLPAGTYYGLVRVDAPGAANTPQVLTVFLQVLPANANVAGVVQPAQLIFTATAGGESPGSQLIQVYNIVAGAKSFQSHVSSDSGLLLITSPQDATLDPQQPTGIVVQPITTGLSSGVYNGAVTLQFSDGTVSAVKVSVIVSNSIAASGSASINKPKSARSADAGTNCTPSKLLPALTTLGQTFTISAGWPTALIVNVKDDCGTPMPSTGSVMVSFSNGDAALLLQSQGGGSFENTWSTGNSTTGVTLTILANSQGIMGVAEVSGNLASQEQPPAFDKSGIVSVAAPVSFTALAPGSVISIFGSRLAESIAQFQTLPLPPQLVDTQLFVTGTAPGGVSTPLLNLPLYYVNQNQVNAIIPYEVSVDTTLQLIVQRGTTLSVPVQIDMAPAQPAVFSSSGTPGSAGLIQVYPAKGGQPYFASPSAAAHAGDIIVLYCTGLGAVNPAIADGAAPQQLTNTVSTPQLVVGGQTAHVKFAGLTPGFAGLYQVNAVVPSGTQTGANVPVTLAIDGQTSPLVTMAIE